MNLPVIRCVGLTKRYGDLLALADLDLEVPRGQVYGYLGPNGAGKSTTIRMLVGLSRPSAGRAEVLGCNPLDARCRGGVGFLPGELRLDEHLSVGKLVEHWARLHGGVSPAYQAELFERLNLDPTRKTRELSTGNRRKVGLVGAFQGRPDLLVLDEPTNGLDLLVQGEFRALVHEARLRGATVFLSSHVLSEVQAVADRVAVIGRGRLLAEGSVEELRHRARQRFDMVFDGLVPEADLRALPGIGGLVVEASHATFTVAGELGPLLELLAHHPPRSLTAPEPDLEEFVLSLYKDPAQEDTEVPRSSGDSR